METSWDLRVQPSLENGIQFLSHKSQVCHAGVKGNVSKATYKLWLQWKPDSCHEKCCLETRALFAQSVESHYFFDWYTELFHSTFVTLESPHANFLIVGPLVFQWSLFSFFLGELPWSFVGPRHNHPNFISMLIFAKNNNSFCFIFVVSLIFKLLILIVFKQDTQLHSFHITLSKARVHGCIADVLAAEPGFTQGNKAASFVRIKPKVRNVLLHFQINKRQTIFPRTGSGLTVRAGILESEFSCSKPVVSWAGCDVTSEHSVLWRFAWNSSNSWILLDNHIISIYSRSLGIKGHRICFSEWKQNLVSELLQVQNNTAFKTDAGAFVCASAVCQSNKKAELRKNNGSH